MTFEPHDSDHVLSKEELDEVKDRATKVIEELSGVDVDAMGIYCKMVGIDVIGIEEY